MTQKINETKYNLKFIALFYLKIHQQHELIFEIINYS